ncbi:iron(III) dicitrate-binding protein [Staphylococcus aureus]|nr:iron(III) dicitrate-binding protein [Staphylococcus aureus]
MNRNIVKLVVFMLILVVAVAGCGQKDTEEKTEMTTIKDELGTEKIKKNPKRVIVLEYSFADYLAALDMKPVGIADVSRHKKIKSELSKIAPTIMLVSGTGDYNANIEAFKTVAKAVGKEKEGEKRLEKHDKISGD